MNEWPANRLPLALPEMRQICEVLRQVRRNQVNMSKWCCMSGEVCGNTGRQTEKSFSCPGALFSTGARVEKGLLTTGTRCNGKFTRASNHICSVCQSRVGVPGKPGKPTCVIFNAGWWWLMIAYQGHSMNARNEHEMGYPTGLSNRIWLQTNRYHFRYGLVVVKAHKPISN